MKGKNQSKIGRIYIHIRRGMVESVKSRGLKESIEVVIHDHDVQPPGKAETTVHCLKSKSRKRR